MTDRTITLEALDEARALLAADIAAMERDFRERCPDMSLSEQEEATYLFSVRERCLRIVDDAIARCGASRSVPATARLLQAIEGDDAVVRW